MFPSIRMGLGTDLRIMIIGYFSTPSLTFSYRIELTRANNFPSSSHERAVLHRNNPSSSYTSTILTPSAILL